MGMDAKANVFYGYNVSVDFRDDEGEYKPTPHGIDFVRQFDEAYFAVGATNQRFDWDYNVQSLILDYIHNQNISKWNAMLKQACESFDMEFNEANCGWWVVCDYR